MEVRDIIAKGRPSASVAHLPEFRYIWGVHDGYEYALEEFENNRLKACDNQTPQGRKAEFVVSFVKKYHHIPTLSDAIEVTRKQIIDKICKWLEDNAFRYVETYGSNYEGFDTQALLEDFVKAMKE